MPSNNGPRTKLGYDMEEIELPYPNKEFKIKEIRIDLSKQSI